MLTKLRGLFRTAVQSVTATILTWGPAQWLLDAMGWNVTSDNVEAALWPVVMTIFYAIFDSLQKSDYVKNQPILRFLIGSAMGGQASPSYDAPSEG